MDILEVLGQSMPQQHRYRWRVTPHGEVPADAVHEVALPAGFRATDITGDLDVSNRVIVESVRGFCQQWTDSLGVPCEYEVRYSDLRYQDKGLLATDVVRPGPGATPAPSAGDGAT